MKKIIILFVLTYSWTLMAQKPLFSIGLTYQPTFYWSYNKSDWNNMPISYRVKPKGFNGQALGLEIERNLSKNYNLMAELAYSDQNQKFISYSKILEIGGEFIKVYNKNISTRFKYLKIPIMLSRLKKVRKFSIFSYLGPQLSVLMDYEHSRISYNVTYANPSEIIYDDPIEEKYFTPYYFHGYMKGLLIDPNVIIYRDFEFAYLYKRYVLGIVGGFGIKRVFNDHYYVGLSSRFEFDVTDSESKENDWGVGGQKYKRGKAHNIRIGLSISAGYIFSVEKEEKLKM